MFAKHFGLASDPFGAETPSAAAFQGEQAARLRDEVRCALQKGAMVLLTGPDGVGKTTLLHLLAEDLKVAGNRVVVTHCSGVLSVANLLRGLDSRRAGSMTMLLFDDAEQIGDEALRQLLDRLVDDKTSNGNVAALFAAPPEFEAQFGKALPKGRPPAGEARHVVEPLHLHEVGPYIECRVEAVGYRGSSLFTADAVARIAHESRGVPRRINALCGNGLFLAFLKSRPAVAVEHVVRAAGGKPDPALRPNTGTEKASNGTTVAAVSPKSRRSGDRAAAKKEAASDASHGIAAMLAALRAKPASAGAPATTKAPAERIEIPEPVAQRLSIDPLAPVAAAVPAPREPTPVEPPTKVPSPAPNGQPKACAAKRTPIVPAPSASPAPKPEQSPDRNMAPRSPPTEPAAPAAVARRRPRNPFVHRPKRPTAHVVSVSEPVPFPRLPALTGDDRASLHAAPASDMARRSRLYARTAIPIGIAAVAMGAFVLVGLQLIGGPEKLFTGWIIETPGMTVAEPAPATPSVASEVLDASASSVPQPPAQTAENSSGSLLSLRVATVRPAPGEPGFQPPVKPLVPTAQPSMDVAAVASDIERSNGAAPLVTAGGATPPGPASTGATQAAADAMPRVAFQSRASPEDGEPPTGVPSVPSQSANSAAQVAALAVDEADEADEPVADPSASPAPAASVEQFSTTPEVSVAPSAPAPEHAEASTPSALPEVEIAGPAALPTPEPSGGEVRVLATLPAPAKVLPPGKPQVSAEFVAPPAGSGARIDCHALSPEQLQRTAEEGQCVEAFVSYVMAIGVSSEPAADASYLGSIEPAAGPVAR